MKVLLLSLLLGLVFASSASAFRVGIVNPTPVPASDSDALGSTMQRYDLVWSGDGSSTDLDLAPDTTPVVAVSPKSYAGIDAERFCDWVGSMLSRYPQVRNVIVGNEPKEENWPAYVATLKFCSPVIRSYGARVIGPGMRPSFPTSVEQPLMDMIGPGLLDAWDQHVYWGNLGEVIQRVKATLGIPVWVTEDGAQSRPPQDFASLYYGEPDGAWNGGLSESDQAVVESSQMLTAYCQGAQVWMSFLLRDEPDLNDWQSGLQRPDGSNKPAYDAFAASASAISSGSVNCPAVKAQTPKAKGVWTPDAALANRLEETGGWTRDAYELER